MQFTTDLILEKDNGTLNIKRHYSQMLVDKKKEQAIT